MDDMIKDAFKQAVKDADKLKAISDRMHYHMDKKTRSMLEVWGDAAEAEGKLPVLLKIAKDNEMIDLVEELGTTFFIGGYLSALDDVRQGEIKP